MSSIKESVTIHPRAHNPTKIDMENILFGRIAVVVPVVLVVNLVRICFIIFVWGIDLRIKLLLLLLFFQRRMSGYSRCSTLGDILYKLRSWTEYNVISDLSLSFDKMIHYIIYAPLKEVNIYLYCTYQSCTCTHQAKY